MSLLKPSRRLLLRQALIAAPALLLVSKTKAGCIIGEGIICRTAGGSLGLQTNLGSFFSLDNTLSDSVGAVTDLTNNNSVAFVTPPGAGLAAVTNCAEFVFASSKSLSHADATGINVAGIDFSLQVWFYATANTRQIANKRSGGFGSREYSVDYTFGTGASNPVRALVDDNTAISTANTPTSAWHHFVLTWNNTSKATIIYLDGASAATGTGANVTAGTSTLFLGADAAGTGGFFDGNLALFGTWRNRILSAPDVTALYNGGAGLSYAAMA